MVHIFKHSPFRLEITVGCLTSTFPSNSPEKRARTLKIAVGCPTCTNPSIRKEKRSRGLSRSRSVHRRAHVQAFSEKLTLSLKSTVGCPRGAHIRAFPETLALSLKSTVGCPRGAHIRRIHLSVGEKSLSRSRSCAEITLCGHHLRPSPFSPPQTKKNPFFFKKNRESWAGHTQRRQRTRETTRRHHATESTM